MRTPALWTLLGCALPLLLVTAGCDDDASTPQPRSGRFAAVKRSSTKRAQRAFCEKVYPADSAESRAFQDPPERPLPQKVGGNSRTKRPGASAAAAEKRGPDTWRYLNLWATWCAPCVEEMPLLGRWMKALQSDGLDVDLELWSVDEEGPDLEKWLASHEMPGRVRWLKDPAQLDPFFEQLGVAKGSAIPVHALVDPAGNTRCVRVGSVHEEDYASIKTLLRE